ncbi:unnamed protein product [Oikopleura dioica]|uniref:Uncharacterized protein n=1 Tax=Oikopleura dioica TaxID=34765 RepID=E4XNJ0_OIKDI|nr:unnamed protein product [Oikopleura dioica]
MIREGGVRNCIEENELKKVLRLLAAGEKKINLKEREFRAFLNGKKRKETQKKFWIRHNWEVAEAGWTIKFKTAFETFGGDGKFFYLWISKKEGGAKFKATAQQINSLNGEEVYQRELQSEKDGTRQLIKYKQATGYGFVRFNITIL